jgi:hypothetical protein
MMPRPDAQRPPLARAAAGTALSLNNVTGQRTRLDLSVSPGARLGDPDTSSAAADMAPEWRQSIASQVLAQIEARGAIGATADEVWENRPDILLSTLSRRITDLAKAGKVVDIGYRRPTRRGAAAVAWVAIEHAPRYTLDAIAEHLDRMEAGS